MVFLSMGVLVDAAVIGIVRESAAISPCLPVAWACDCADALSARRVQRARRLKSCRQSRVQPQSGRQGTLLAPLAMPEPGLFLSAKLRRRFLVLVEFHELAR